MMHAHEAPLSAGCGEGESKTFRVLLLTGTMMIAEVVAGYWTGSMALLADGWHMGTHALALGISYLAFRLARKYAESEHFTYGTGKISVLGGYTSAFALGGAGAWMIVESVSRLIHPVPIVFGAAVGVAVLGLAVNLASIWIMKDSHPHHHGHDHSHAHGHEEVAAAAGIGACAAAGHEHSCGCSHDHAHDHDDEPNAHGGEHGDPAPERSALQRDHSFRAAYLHVIADAMTSVLAILALLAGWGLGWNFLDPVMGLVGGLVICRWAWGLLCDTGRILLDMRARDGHEEQVRTLVEADTESEVLGLRHWQTGSGGCAISVLIRSASRPAEEYRERLAPVAGLTHLQIEVQRDR